MFCQRGARRRTVDAESGPRLAQISDRGGAAQSLTQVGRRLKRMLLANDLLDARADVADALVAVAGVSIWCGQRQAR